MKLALLLFGLSKGRKITTTAPRVRKHYIINYNVPKNRDSYFHRIGRTARIGTEVIGKAITIVAGRETRDFVELKREIKTNVTPFKGKQIYRYEVPLDEQSFRDSGRRNGRGGSPRYGRGGPNRSSSGGRRYGGSRSGGYGGRSGGSSGNREGSENRSGYFTGENRNNSEKTRSGNKDNKKSQYKKRSRKTTY